MKKLRIVIWWLSFLVHKVSGSHLDPATLKFFLASIIAFNKIFRPFQIINFVITFNAQSYNELILKLKFKFVYCIKNKVLDL